MSNSGTATMRMFGVMYITMAKIAYN
jgi:hypothetical protein